MVILFGFYGNLLGKKASQYPRRIDLKCDVRHQNAEKRNKPSIAWTQLFNTKSSIDPKTHDACGGDSGGNVTF